MCEVYTNDYALEIYFKAYMKTPDIKIGTNKVSVVRVSDGFLHCIDNEDIIHCYNLDDIHAYHVDTRKVRFYEATNK